MNDSIPLPDESGALHELLGGIRDLLREHDEAERCTGSSRSDATFAGAIRASAMPGTTGRSL